MNWKAAPEDKSKFWLSKSIEIQILLNCNWNCHACFTGNTKIDMGDGTVKKISEIEVGDVVISYDEDTQQFVKKPVTKIMSRKTEELYKLQTNGWKPTYVTGCHPFLVRDKGWVNAEDLETGDKILHFTVSDSKRLNNPMKDPERAAAMGAKRKGIIPNIGKEGKKRSAEAARRRMLTNNPMKDPKTAIKGFLNRKDRGKKFISETFTEEACKGLGLKFVGDGSLIVADKSPDFIIDGTNKLVEVWKHGTGGLNGRDKQWKENRRRLFAKEGYEVLFLPVKCRLKSDKNRKVEMRRVRKVVAEYKRNGREVKSITKITRETNPKSWTRITGEKSQSAVVYNLEVKDTHTYVAHSMVVHNCDQFSNLPSISWVRKATMTVEQIVRFGEEMRSNNTYIGRVRILGGEPTLHPKLGSMVQILNGLKEDGFLGQLEIITNGSHKEKLADVKKMLDKVRVSDMKDKEKHHTANLVHTPASLGYMGLMCNAPFHCGISLNYYGYFPCSSGAGLARLMNDMEQWQRLELPKRKVLDEWPNLQKLCDYCYHGLKAEDKVKCGTDDFGKNVPNQEMWSHLAPWLHGKQPDWKVYGESV